MALSNMNLKTHPVAWVVRPYKADLYDEPVVEIRIEDEGGGPFLVVKSQMENAKPGELGIDKSEWPTLRDAIEAAFKVVMEIDKEMETKTK
jgi:hypothetical protein